MAAAGERIRDHYQALGVRAEASSREIELAFYRWREERRRMAIDEEDYLLAEKAYHVLADQEQRAAHDRRIGRSVHPAWAAERLASARRCRRAGMRHLARGRPEASLAQFRRATVLSPEDPASRSYLALLLARTGASLHEAARHGEYAVERNPHEPVFLFNLAAVYALAGLRTRAFRIRLRAWRYLLRRIIRRKT